MLWLLFACQDQQVYLQDGKYVANLDAGVMGIATALDSEMLEAFELDLSLSTNSAELILDDVSLDASSEDDTFEVPIPELVTVEELPTEEWQVGCPMPVVEVRNQTIRFDTGFSLGTTVLETPIMFADGCIGELGKNVSSAWLSTQAFQDTIPNVGMGMINLILVE